MENVFETKSLITGLSEMSDDEYKTEALRRANLEREEIVEKYRKGESNEEEEDNWQDAKLKLYRVTDRYGFLQEEELSVPSLEEEKRKQTEVKRQYKWVKMLQKWNNNASSEKLRSRVYKGIPLNLRGDAWRLMLNVETLKKNKPTTYEEMKQKSLLLSPDIKQIDMDVNRTYRNNIMFRTRYSIKQQQLFNVLTAYSLYNTEVGYCQGMSQIAALLLMYMSEEEAFWALHSLLYGEKHRMHGFFIPGFPKLMRFQDHHDRILKKFMPGLKKHLDRNEIFASLYTMKWFFQCFLDRAPFRLTLRLWDIYVFEGERLLTAMSYTTLKMHKATVKKMEMEEVVAFLQERLNNSFGYDDDSVVEQLRLNMAELKRGRMDLPPPPGEDEEPKLPFGVEVTPTFEQVTGIRSSISREKPSLNQDQRKENSSATRSGESLEANGAINTFEDVTVSNKSQQRKLSKKVSNGKNDGKKVTAPTANNRQRRSVKEKQDKKEKSSKDKDKRQKKSKTGSKNDSIKSTTHKETEHHKEKWSSPSDTVNGNVVLENSQTRNQYFNQDDQSVARLPSNAPGQTSSSPDGNKSSALMGNEVGESHESSPKPIFAFPSQSTDLAIAEDSYFINANTTHQRKNSSSKAVMNITGGTYSSLQYDTADKNEQFTSHNISQDCDTLRTKTRIKSSDDQDKSQSMYNYESKSADIVKLRTSLEANNPHREQLHLDLQNKSRPVSTYDNVYLSMTEEEENDLEHLMSSLMPNKAIEVDADSLFEAKMEKSLENLRELAAGLSHTPSPRCLSTSETYYGSAPRQHQISPTSVTSLFDIGLHKQRYSRSKSLELSDDDDDITALAALDATARSLSKSVEVLQEKQRTSVTDYPNSAGHSDSTFSGNPANRNHAGDFNYRFPQNTDSFISQRSESVAPENRDVSSIEETLLSDFTRYQDAKYNSKLEEGDMNSKSTTNYVPFDINRIETHPIVADFGECRNSNNSNRVGISYEHLRDHHCYSNSIPLNQSKVITSGRIDRPHWLTLSSQSNPKGNSHWLDPARDTSTNSEHKMSPQLQSENFYASASLYATAPRRQFNVTRYDKPKSDAGSRISEFNHYKTARHCRDNSFDESHISQRVPVSTMYDSQRSFLPTYRTLHTQEQPRHFPEQFLPSPAPIYHTNNHVHQRSNYAVPSSYARHYAVPGSERSSPALNPATPDKSWSGLKSGSNGVASTQNGKHFVLSAGSPV